MVTVSLSKDRQKLILKSNYYYSDRLRELEGAHFDHENKVWIIPVSGLSELETEFNGELYFKTPKWDILGQPKPEKKKKGLYTEQKINVPKLTLPMYDYQIEGTEFMIDRILSKGYVLNADDVGLGKCHGKGTEILMADGEIRKVEDIQVGDRLMGDDGSPRNVLSLAHGKEQMYRVELCNGDSFTCNESHILSLKIRGKTVNISVREYLKRNKTSDAYYAYKQPIQDFGNNDIEYDEDPYDYGLNVMKRGEESISSCYKCGPVETRKQALAGIIDAIGIIPQSENYLRVVKRWGNFYDIYTDKKQLSRDVRFIAQSLGLSVTHNQRDIDGETHYFVSIYDHANMLPLKVKESDAPTMRKLCGGLFSFDIVPLGVGEYFGFTLDGNHLYLLGDFTVTHNTVQTIGTIKFLIKYGFAKKTLIICKKSIKGQWGREIKKFSGAKKNSLPIFTTGETKKLREEAYRGIAGAKYGILITNYHNFLNDVDLIKGLGCDLVVVDEVHTLKSHDGKMNNNVGKVIRGLPTIYLTGTPIMSRPSDIFGIMQMAAPELFGSYRKFSDDYLIFEKGIYGVQIVGARNLDKLNEIIQGFMIRRTAEDVSIDLPEVTREEIVVEEDRTQHAVDFKLQEKVDFYQQKKQKMLDRGIEPDSSEFQKVLDEEKMYLAAKQFVADDPRCFMRLPDTRFAKEVIPMIPKNYKMSPKTETTIDLVEDILASEKKVIIFTHFKTAGDILEDDIRKKLKVNVLRYTGAEKDEQREKNIQLFTESEGHNILIGTEACAEGLNLQCANYLINFEQPDTHAQKEQRIGRIRRAGSAYSHAHVYDMVSEYSMDRIKLNKIERDRDLSASLIE